jgi:hypothetical protein
MRNCIGYGILAAQQLISQCLLAESAQLCLPEYPITTFHQLYIEFCIGDGYEVIDIHRLIDIFWIIPSLAILRHVLELQMNLTASHTHIVSSILIELDIMPLLVVLIEEWGFPQVLVGRVQDVHGCTLQLMGIHFMLKRKIDDDEE